MKFDSAKAVFCGVVLLSTALPADGSGTFHITMEQPAPYYSPLVATVPAGSRIQWKNETATAHTVTHDGCLAGQVCAFDSGSVAPGNSFSMSFLPPGTYSYYCRLHPIMRGTIMVQRNKIEPGPKQNGQIKIG